MKIIMKKIPFLTNEDYMAGSDGKIYSRRRYVAQKGCRKKEYANRYPLKGYDLGEGYKTICLCHNNKYMVKSVHRLVCMAFHGMPLKKTLEVRHLDGNPKNNNPKNLCWGTAKENWLDRKAHGRGIEGEKHPMSKVSNKECEYLRWAIKIGLCSQKHAARIMGISQAAISYIINSRGK